MNRDRADTGARAMTDDTRTPLTAEDIANVEEVLVSQERLDHVMTLMPTDVLRRLFDAARTPSQPDLREALRWWADVTRRMFAVAPIEAVAAETGTFDRQQSIETPAVWLARDLAALSQPALAAVPASEPEEPVPASEPDPHLPECAVNHPKPDADFVKCDCGAIQPHVWNPEAFAWVEVPDPAILDRLMELWQQPWSEEAFGEAQMLVARLRFRSRPSAPASEPDLRLAALRAAYFAIPAGDPPDEVVIARLPALYAAIEAVLGAPDPLRAAPETAPASGEALRADPWLEDIVRCGEAALAKWQEAHRNEETLALTFKGADGPFYEGIRSVVERLRDYHFAHFALAAAPPAPDAP